MEEECALNIERTYVQLDLHSASSIQAGFLSAAAQITTTLKRSFKGFKGNATKYLITKLYFS